MHLFSEKILIADKSENHVLYRRLPKFVTAAAWYGLICKANGMARTIAFPFRRRQKKVVRCFTMHACVFGCGFLSSHTTIVSGIKNYPSACISCCSNDLLLLLLCLDLWSLGSEDKFLPLSGIYKCSKSCSSNKIRSLTVLSFCRNKQNKSEV